MKYIQIEVTRECAVRMIVGVPDNWDKRKRDDDLSFRRDDLMRDAENGTGLDEDDYRHQILATFKDEGDAAECGDTTFYNLKTGEWEDLPDCEEP